MKPIKPCSAYHAVISDRSLLRNGDGKSAFKIYYVDIVGRENPARTEWDKSGIDKVQFEASLAAAATVEGIGFVTAFPHITKVFRFGPEAETVLNVKAWNTADMSHLDLARSDGYVEFACLAEAVLAADEYLFWAQADSVEEYLSNWSDCADAPVRSNTKLADYWG